MSRYAVLDLGSNSFHLLVADVVGSGRIRRVTTRKLQLRLAEPVARTGKLGKEARQRSLSAVGELLATARAEGADRAIAVATSAIREAADGERLRDRIGEEHGVEVRVLDGLEEGYCSLRGMAAALHLPSDGTLLGLDLGGGSYEVVYGGYGPLLAGTSLPLGGAHLRDRFRHEPPRLVERTALHDEALAALRPVAAEVASRRHGEGPPRAVATAGTIRDLGRLGLALATGTAPQRIRGVVVTRTQLERAYARLCSVPTEERAELPGVSVKRADLLPAGGAVVLATMEALGLEQLELCDWGLREGVLLDALSDGIIGRAEDARSLPAARRAG
jgi:exopolyphosphatase / guanosine-5'-triphosphate,3'-diphosphate pyrophosphatase